MLPVHEFDRTKYYHLHVAAIFLFAKFFPFMNSVVYKQVKPLCFIMYII